MCIRWPFFTNESQNPFFFFFWKIQFFRSMDNVIQQIKTSGLRWLVKLILIHILCVEFLQELSPSNRKYLLCGHLSCLPVATYTLFQVKGCINIVFQPSCNFFFLVKFKKIRKEMYLRLSL